MSDRESFPVPEQEQPLRSAEEIVLRDRLACRDLECEALYRRIQEQDVVIAYLETRLGIRRAV